MCITIKKQERETWIQDTVLVNNTAFAEVSNAFAAVFGDDVQFNWTREKQIEVIKSPLREHVGAAWRMGLVPMWSLRGVDLSRLNLREADLRNAIITYANMHDVDLSNSNLGWANFSGSNLIGVNLRSANLYGANLSSSDLEMADLSEANLDGADFGHANLTGVNFSGASMRGANLYMANLSKDDLGEIVELPGWNIERLGPIKINLDGAILTGARMPDGTIHR